MAWIIGFGSFVIYFGQGWSVFVAIKAFWEAYKTATTNFVMKEHQEHDHAHKRGHIVGALGIGFYAIFDVFSFQWFRGDGIYMEAGDYTIAFFNLLAINVLFLMIIDHFKQERVGKMGKSTWIDLLKF
jgi:hypothetical protein